MPKPAMLLIVAAAVLVTGCASTEESELTAGQQVICRDTHEIGSRLNRRVCKTANEWEAERDIQQDAMRNRNRGRADMPQPPVASGPP